LRAVDEGLEQRIVIEDPVKCRVAEDDVCHILQLQVKQVAGDEADSVFEFRKKMLLGSIYHTGGLIDGDDVPVGQTLKQETSEAPGPATRVDHRFEPFER
jgi:hypothetical protein